MGSKNLVCTSCGLVCSHADAYFADQEVSCNGETHDWTEPIHKKVDVI